MRDPNRIGPTLEAIRQAWEADPDLRLGQLICNAVHKASPAGRVPPFPPIFYIEDDVLVTGLTIPDA